VHVVWAAAVGLYNTIKLLGVISSRLRCCDFPWIVPGSEKIGDDIAGNRKRVLVVNG
jgi:hypothetical protein